MSTVGFGRRKAGRWTLAAPLLLVLLLGAWLWAGADRGEADVGDAQWWQLVHRFRDERRPSRPPAVLAFVAADGPSSGDRSHDDVRPAPRPMRLALDADLQRQRQQAYDADVAKGILDLQRFRLESEAEVERADGVRGRARLVNLAPEVNLEYLLLVRWGQEAEVGYHLSNSAPLHKDLALSDDFAGGILLADRQRAERCALWDRDAAPSLAQAVQAGVPYVPLCHGRVLLRLPSRGRKTTIERVTDFLRDNIWGGEQLTVFVRETFYRDAFLQHGEVAGGDGAPALGLSEPPPPAAIGSDFAGRAIVPAELGLPLRGVEDLPLTVGRWYPVAGSLGIWLSTVQPRMLAEDIVDADRAGLTPLDEVERGALTYLVAFDLELLEVGFVLGTDHPRLEWSDRVPAASRADSLPGPDGVGDAAPLVRAGVVPAALTPRVAATFIGGFKRSHGGFKYGELSQRHHGSHYGFIENGVVYSKLQPGLATIFTTVDGGLRMKTWQEGDDALVPSIVAARQNGVAILEHAADLTAVGVPGAYVTRWGHGNWSGSKDGRYRTLRAGACTIAAGDRTFLAYGYFSGATPSAMARVFEAYGCSYAMLLDMNALEHTYLATYRIAGDRVAVAHLINGMSVLDKETEDGTRPRFLAFADNRDFFYVLRRHPGGGP